jgi:hypothetical protein
MIGAKNSVVRLALPGLLIILVGVIFMYPLWPGRGIAYSKYSDIIAQHLSIYTIDKYAVRNEGSLPLWNPSMNAGLPAFANPETMYIFPFDLLFFILPIDIATNTVILLNVLLTGLSMYLFSRLFFSYATSVFCAIAYMLSYRYMAMIYAGWLPKMSMYALTPLLFWSCEKLLQKPTARRTVLFSVIIGLSLIQGDMQQFYYAGLGLIIYAIIRLIVSTGTVPMRMLLCLTGSGLLGAMLAAPALLPRLEYALLSTRTEADYEFFLCQPPTLPDLTTLADPYDEGGNRDEFWENNFYFGFWLFPLLLFAFRKEWRRPAALILAASIMILLCFNTVMLKFCYEFVPGFGLFRQSPRLLFLAQFMLVFASGIGAENILTATTNKKRFHIFSAGALVIMGTGLIATFELQINPLYIITALLIFIGLLVFIKRQSGTPAIVFLCLLPVIDSAVRVHPMLSVQPLSEAAPQHAVHKLLNRQQGRTIAIDRASIPYGMAGYYGIDMINGYSSMSLRHFIEYFSILQHGSKEAIPHQAVVWTDFTNLARPDMLGALDVHYIVTNNPQPLENLGYKKIAEYKQVPVFVFYEGIKQVPIEVWRSENPLGPAYFASWVRGVENEPESLNAIAATESVLNAYVMGLDKDISRLNYAGGTVKLLYRGYNKYEYQVESNGDNFLILSQIWYPGWTATLNGEKIKLYRTNHALTGCFVPQGQYNLVLKMTSPMLNYGTITACIAILVLAVICVAKRIRSPK